MIIKCYKFLSNWLSWVVLILMMGTSPIIQAATDCDAVTEISKGECESLLELYNSTDGANWTDNTGWNVTNTPCSWYGVSCSNGGVSSINLSENQLSGTIPNLSVLSKLEHLSFSKNQLSGTIPDFSALPKLEQLYLYSNKLSGTIPDFSALPNLKELSLSKNQLSGSIPGFSALPKLEQLYLYSNKLSGTIPDFSALPNLKELSLSKNQLSGTIPDFSALPNLKELYLYSNKLSGTIPDFSALPNLKELALYPNPQLCKDDTNTNDNKWQIEINKFSDCSHSLSISSGNGGSISSSPTKDSYNHNETVNLTANPKQCYKFSGWGGACSGSSSCKLTMDSDKSVTANFDLKTYGLTIKTQGGKVTSNNKAPAQNYNCGSEVKLTAVPDAGYSFVRWQGVNSSSNSNISITMNSDKTITAIFEAKTHNLSISSGNGGSISRSPTKDSYNHNETVNLTATPEQCYKFTGWGDACSGSSSCQLTMDSDKSVTANFEIKSFKLNINSDNGSIERQPNKTLYDCGETVKLTARPNQGYKFKAWSGDANGSNENITVNMDANKNITATFEAVTYKLNLSTLPLNLPPDVTVNINPQKSDYNAGEKVTLTANPSSDYRFDHWEGDISGNQTTTTLVIAQDMNITAVFKQVQAMNINPSFVEMNLGEIKILSVSGGVEPYQWSSSNGGQLSPIIGKQVNFSANNANSEGYKITVTDSRGETAEATIKVFSELKVSPNVITMEIEETKSFQITGGKPPYNINNGQTSSITDKGNGIFSFNFTAPDTAGNITITVTDALSRQQSVQISVEAPKPLKVTPVGPLTLSFGGNIELTASDGRPPYNWTITDGQLTSKKGTSTTYIAPKIAGDNTITVTDEKGEKAEVKVKVISELICTPTLVTVILGDPNPVTFKAAGGAEPYKWSADNGPINPIEAPEADYQPPAQTGEYHVTCKDNKDSSITALVRVVPSVVITPAQIDLATGEVATLQVTGGQKPYTWITEAGDLSSTSGSRISYTAPTRNGVYSITVTDALKQAAKARIQVLGNLIISPIKTVVTIGENIHLSAARGAEPYTWPDGKTGRTWNTKFTQVGRQEVVVTDAAGDTGLAVVDIIHAELGLTPETAYLHPSEVVNFFVTGGTSPYAWSAEAGTLSNLKGQRIGYVAPEQPGEYTITVADGRDKVGQAKVTVTAGVTDSSGKLQTNRGAIRSGIIIDGVAHHSDHILTDAAAHIEISFPLTMPNDGQKYNTYGAILWTPPQAAPVFLFRTTNIVNPFQVFDGATFPIYQATSAGENVVIDIYRGALNGLSGQFNFYAGYAPITATNVLESLLFNSKPFSLEVK